MKKHLLCLFILGCTLTGYAQNTWIQKLYFQDLHPYFNHTDSLTGIKAIEIAADGDIFVVANFGLANENGLFKMDPSGSPVRWKVLSGGSGILSGFYITTVKATPDSGCIVAHNGWSQSGMWYIAGVIEKYSKDGISEWSQLFYTPAYEREAKDVSVIGNNYYAHVGDSVVKIDQAGNILSYDPTLKFPLQQMPNTDLIVRSPSLGLARIDTGGTVIWSSTIFGNCGCPASYFYEITGANSVSRIDLRDGSTVWNKSYPWSVSDLDSTADGGFVASFGTAPFDISSECTCAGPGTIFKADVNGDTLWSRTYNFPHYGLPKIEVHPNGNIITGGGFVFSNYNFQSYFIDYSSFLAMLDSTGQGVLETTNFTWPGDANNNQLLSFADDALYVTMAWNSTGPPRDTMDTNGNLGAMTFVYMPGTHSDIATDWTGVFGNGANYKHADFNGDGIINNGDLTPYSPAWWFPMTVPNLRTGNPEVYNFSVPDFNLLPEQDTVPPGAQIKYFVTIGNSNVPVDSIYGLVFTLTCNYSLLVDTPQVNYVISDMGTPGSDLMGYDFNLPDGMGPGNGPNVMISRIDYNNAYQVNDTIAELVMVAKPTISSIQTLTLNISDFNALTIASSTVPFNLISNPVVIDPNATVGVETNEISGIEIFPNPADNEFTMHNSQFTMGTASVSIFNLIGENVKTITRFNPGESISVADLPEGFYTGQITIDKAVKNFSFVVKH